MEVLESHYFHIPYPGALKALGECGQARGLRWKPEASCQAERRRREREKTETEKEGQQLTRTNQVRAPERTKGGLVLPKWPFRPIL